MSTSQSLHSHEHPISPPSRSTTSGQPSHAPHDVFLRALVHPSVAVFVALAPPILSAVGSSTSSTLVALVPHIAHAVLLVLAGVYLYFIVQVPWDLYQVAARRADALALLESSAPGAYRHDLISPTTPKSTSRSASATSSSAAASCTIHATFTLHPPDGPARWLARGAFAMSLASPVIGSALLLAVKSRLRDAWWIPLELLDPVPFALAASIRPLLHLAASAARAAASAPSVDTVANEGVVGAHDSLTGSVGPAAAAAASASAEAYSSSSRTHQHQQHHHQPHPYSHSHGHTHVHRAARVLDSAPPDSIPVTWLPHLNPSASAFLDPIPTPSPAAPPSSWVPNLSSSKSVHTHLAALHTHLALHLKHLDAALLASSSSPPQPTHSFWSLSPHPSSLSLLTSLLSSPTSWLSAHLPRPNLHVAAYLPTTPPVRTWVTWLLLGWLRWIVACIVLPLAAWITLVRATWWVLTLVPKQVIRHAIEAPPAPSPPVQPSAEAKRRRRGSVPANDELAAEAPAPAASASTSPSTVTATTEDVGGSTSVVEDTASLVDALLSRVLPAGIYSAPPTHHVHSKQRRASPAPATGGKSGAAAAGARSRTRSRGARGSQLRPLSAPVAGAAGGNGEHKRPATVAAQ